MYGEYNEVSYSSFTGKNGVGSIINEDVTVEISAADIAGLKNAIHRIDRIKKIEEADGNLYLSVGKDFNPAELNRLAFEKGIVLTHLVKKQKSLEAEFLEITK